MVPQTFSAVGLTSIVDWEGECQTNEDHLFWPSFHLKWRKFSSLPQHLGHWTSGLGVTPAPEILENRPAGSAGMLLGLPGRKPRRPCSSHHVTGGDQPNGYSAFQVDIRVSNDAERRNF